MSGGASFSFLSSPFSSSSLRSSSHITTLFHCSAWWWSPSSLLTIMASPPSFLPFPLPLLLLLQYHKCSLASLPLFLILLLLSPHPRSLAPPANIPRDGISSPFVFFFFDKPFYLVRNKWDLSLHSHKGMLLVTPGEKSKKNGLGEEEPYHLNLW